MLGLQLLPQFNILSTFHLSFHVSFQQPSFLSPFLLGFSSSPPIPPTQSSLYLHLSYVICILVLEHFPTVCCILFLRVTSKRTGRSINEISLWTRCTSRSFGSQVLHHKHQQMREQI